MAMDRGKVVQLREDLERRCKRLCVNVLGEWPEFPLEEILNALDATKNHLVSAEAPLDDPDDADLEVEGVDDDFDPDEDEED